MRPGSITQTMTALNGQKAQIESDIKKLENIGDGRFLIDLYDIFDAPPVMQLPNILALTCFNWCYEEDIHFRIVTLDGPNVLNTATFEHREWVFIEFKDDASLVAFKLRWGSATKAELEGYDDINDDEIPF